MSGGANTTRAKLTRKTIAHSDPNSRLRDTGGVVSGGETRVAKAMRPIDAESLVGDVRLAVSGSRRPTRVVRLASYGVFIPRAINFEP